MKNILKLEHVDKEYGQKESRVSALKDVNIQVEQGEFIAIVGTSGSGKSTLLNLIGGLDNPTNGKIFVNNKELSELNSSELTKYRRRNIGFVFQNYSLMPVLNVYDNVALPITFDRKSRLNHKFIEELLNELGIWDKRRKYPSELSGGQKQRVAIARALVNKPAILLADEPTGNLDTKTTDEVMALLKKSNRLYHQTILMVTHNEALAKVCDRVIHIEDGNVMKGEHQC
jgi:putative ABC transport system ATP-binding protein